jgi:hypothetical protein
MTDEQTAAVDGGDTPNIARRIVGWLNAGYPEGVDPRDFPAVLAVLERRLTEADLDEIAGDLAAASGRSGRAITAEDVQRMVHEHAFQNATPQDMFRVSARLAAGGWPLATDF